MASHSSATALPKTPHVTNPIKEANNSTKNRTALTKNATKAAHNGNSSARDVTKSSNHRLKSVPLTKHRLKSVPLTEHRLKSVPLTEHRLKSVPLIKTVSYSVKRRAQSLIKDKTIDAQSRAVIRYALETNDPWLPELVRRADTGKPILDEAGFLIKEQQDSPRNVVS